MHTIRQACLAVAAAALSLGAAAQSDIAGPYAVAALGRAQYEYDCYLFDCDSAQAAAGKLLLGHRWGVFAVEALWLDFGQADTYRVGERQSMRALGLSACWTLQFAGSVEGRLRAGLADVRRWRSSDGSNRSVEPTFGIAAAHVATPQWSWELAWDVARFYGTDNEGTSYATALTAGLRWRF